MDLEKVPEALRNSANWILWRLLDGDRKTPWQANNNAPAKSNDPKTWTTFNGALAAFKKGYHAGLGYVFSPDDVFCGIDLDNCRGEEGTEEWAKEVIAKFDSYTEVSPSGNGFKIFCKGQSPFQSGKKIWIDKDKKQAIEIYDNARFFAITGERVGGISLDVEARQEALQWLSDKFEKTAEPIYGTGKSWTDCSAITERARAYVQKMPAAVAGQSGHNQTFSVACTLILGFELSASDAMKVLAEYNERCQPPWTEKELAHKIKSATQQPGPRGYLSRVRPENFNKIEVPQYYEPKAAPKETSTLADAVSHVVSVLEKGPQVLVELGVPGLDSALGGGVDFGEMVVVAGRPSHGKSAIALQFMHYLSERDIKTLIVSEEMSSHSLAQRAMLFASTVPKEEWHRDVVSLSRDMSHYFRHRSDCFIAEACGTIDKVASTIEHHVASHGVKLVIVDYLQLVSAKGGNETEQVGIVSKHLRKITTKHGIILIALVQLNRELDKRDKFIPKLTDIRQSGQIEQDADVVMFTVWPHRLDSSLPANEYQIFVRKNRNREIRKSIIQCRFEPSRQRLMEAVNDAEARHEHFDRYTAGEF